ncbi:(Fe-S)-binding protein [Desulfitobacterium hafniense]|uniref:(Fe-S)-binding protein n=1 Tax=Desulfitobacterium hafniense TaxID=49338 RepID=UPI00037835C2|nr:(Fe-S)-binding protein [Desulfitobacterium hafniense]
MQSAYHLNFAEELKKCVKCGTCRAHCPLFAEIKGEYGAPRGRLALIKQLQEGRIKPTPELAEILYTCLLCKTCAVECPSGVITDEIIIASRNYLHEVMRQPAMKGALLKGFLTRPGLLYASMSLAGLYQKTGLHNALSKMKLFDLLPEKLNACAKIMPDVDKKPARSRIPVVTPAQGEKRFRVAYFLGCATNHIYPDVPVAGVKVLSYNGCEVVTVEGVKCCGMPHMAYGELATAKEMAKHNMEILFKEDYDAIISDCASCSSTFKELYTHLFSEGEYEYEMARQLAAKTWDLSQFLVKKTGIRPGKKERKIRVTYHDPCHLKRAQKIFKEPRELLTQIPGVEFVEMKNADRCCGSAGSFTVMHHDLSMKVLEKKINAALAVKPDFVATSCPTCTMQLGYGLRQAGSDIQVIHPVQILAEAYADNEGVSFQALP